MAGNVGAECPAPKVVLRCATTVAMMVRGESQEPKLTAVMEHDDEVSIAGLQAVLTVGRAYCQRRLLLIQRYLM